MAVGRRHRKRRPKSGKKKRARLPRKKKVVRRKKKRQSPGPKSLRTKSKQHAKRSGMRERAANRVNSLRANESMKTYRKGYNLMWRLCPGYMAKVKSAKKPGEFDKNNVHAGKLWATHKECTLTGRQAAQILEKVYEAGATEAQLKKVRASLSYAFFLTTGKPSRNYPKVNDMMETFGELEPAKFSIKPERVATPAQLKAAFTRPWRVECGMSLMRWSVGLLISWDWTIAGSRGREDLKRIKNSTDHVIDAENGIGSTGFVEGRSKLSGRKRNSRPWRAFRKCLCPDGKHKPVPAYFKHRIQADGNPRTEPPYCTNCPVAAMELVSLKQDNDVQLYRKWFTNKRDGGRFTETNVGDCPKEANEWFRAQEVADEAGFSSNSGRMALAGWLSETKTTYEKGFEIHGDLWPTWQGSYQPDCENPTGFKRRTQSTNPKIATAAYENLQQFFGVVSSESRYNRTDRVMLLIAGQLGISYNNKFSTN